MTADINDVQARGREFLDGEVIPRVHLLQARGRAGADVLSHLRSEVKARGLWALGYPKEIGGGGLSFTGTAWLNEIVGRSALARRIFFERRIRSRLRQWHSVPDRELLYVERIGAGLLDHLPPLSKPTIVHGDYRLGNLLLQLESTVRSNAIID